MCSRSTSWLPQFVAIARVAAATTLNQLATMQQCWKIPALPQADAQHYDDLSKKHIHTAPHTHTHTHLLIHTRTHTASAAPKTVQLTSLAATLKRAPHVACN